MGDPKRVIGFRETLRMLKQDKVSNVILAKDTDDSMKVEIEELCKEKQVPVKIAKSRRRLGFSSGIERPASVIAVLKEPGQ